MAVRGFQVVTLNVWGLPDLPFAKLSPFRAERIRAICRELELQAADPEGWDVVLLQEAWLGKDRAALKASGFRHSVDLDEWYRPLDSGLLILSRHPFSPRTIARKRFSTGGHFGRSFEDGEFFASKSGILGRVEHPGLGGIWIANAHLLAHYTKGKDIYLESRMRQLDEFLDWVLALAADEPVVLGGDLNFGPGSVEWERMRKRLPDFCEAPNAAEIFTLDRACPKQAVRFGIAGGHKVDHLLASPHFHAVQGQLTFDAPLEIAGQSLRFSDHFGLHTHFQLRTDPILAV
jgi:endonuclease/exonuclease/phosphatase family metal-dependent hydrolase